MMPLIRSGNWWPVRRLLLAKGSAGWTKGKGGKGVDAECQNIHYIQRKTWECMLAYTPTALLNDLPCLEAKENRPAETVEWYLDLCEVYLVCSTRSGAFRVFSQRPVVNFVGHHPFPTCERWHHDSQNCSLFPPSVSYSF